MYQNVNNLFENLKMKISKAEMKHKVHNLLYSLSI